MILFSSPAEKLRLGLLVAIEQRRPTTDARRDRVVVAILTIARRHKATTVLHRLRMWMGRGRQLRATRRTQRLILAMIRDGSMFRNTGPLWVSGLDGREVRSFPGLTAIKSARFVRGRVV